jgi:hypothetical protein
MRKDFFVTHRAFIITRRTLFPWFHRFIKEKLDANYLLYSILIAGLCLNDQYYQK